MKDPEKTFVILIGLGLLLVACKGEEDAVQLNMHTIRLESMPADKMVAISVAPAAASYWDIDNFGLFDIAYVTDSSGMMDFQVEGLEGTEYYAFIQIDADDDGELSIGDLVASVTFTNEKNGVSIVNTSSAVQQVTINQANNPGLANKVIDCSISTGTFSVQSSIGPDFIEMRREAYTRNTYDGSGDVDTSESFTGYAAQGTYASGICYQIGLSGSGQPQLEKYQQFSNAVVGASGLTINLGTWSDL